jgi:hypothetical protein
MWTGVPRGSSLARVVMLVLDRRIQPWLVEWPMLLLSSVPCTPICPGPPPKLVRTVEKADRP